MIRPRMAQYFIQFTELASKASRNHKTFRAAELDHMHIDGQINNSFGSAFAPSVVNTCHEISERQ